MPIAIITLPQFGSSPAIAVFTSGELATENAIFFASSSLLHFVTSTCINFDAPSPSLTTLFAKFNKTLFTALLKSLNLESLKSLIVLFFALPVEKIVIISFVLVSPSQVIALNVLVIFFLSTFFKIFEDKSASVKI